MGKDSHTDDHALSSFMSQQGLLKTIIDYIPDQIYIKDTESRFVLCNPAVIVNTGTSNTEEMTGLSDFDFFPQEDALKYFEDEQALMKSGKPLINHEETIVNKKTGEVRWNLTTKIPLKDKDGNLLGLIGINRDITELKRAQEESLFINQQLKELNATKDKFFSIIAHDLKNPFNQILGFSDLLQGSAKDKDTATVEYYAGIIHSSAHHTHELLENLLEWANSQRGKMPFNPKPFLLNHLVAEEIEVIRIQTTKKNIVLTNRVRDEMVITADENMIGTCIRNLLTNAIKFTPKNGKVQIDAKVLDSAIEISVKDNGIGMKRESVENLFKIETSFTTQGTDNEKGTGLGLILCREFVEKHDGQIRVRSELGKGSEFIISLKKHSE